MFYQPKDGHGLPHDPFKALVAPRPIGWISTRSKAGIFNLAPYSFFNILSDDPYLVWFSSSGLKHSATLAIETGEFVANFVSADLVDAMIKSSVDAPSGVDEFAYAGLTPVASQLISAPRVGEAHAALECKVTQAFQPERLDGGLSSSYVVIGQVVGVHIDDAYLIDGQFDLARAGAASRLGYLDYAITSETFARRRPKWDK